MREEAAVLGLVGKMLMEAEPLGQRLEAVRRRHRLVFGVGPSGETLSSAGFGIGAGGTGSSGAGGGGWYGGGAGWPAGGGSGYVYTASSATNYPSGCLLNSSHYLSNAQTIAGNQSFPAPGGGNETGHSGNGYARITLVE